MSEDLKERIEKMLAGLGNSPDAVADSLRRREISGARGDGCLCPVSNLIRSEFPQAADDRDWGESANWFVDITGVLTPDGQVELPQPVASFISLCDEQSEHDRLRREEVVAELAACRAALADALAVTASMSGEAT